MNARRITCALGIVAFMVLSGACVERRPVRHTARDRELIAKFVSTKIPAEVSTPKHVQFGDLVTYVGLNVETTQIVAGQPFALTHVWQVHKPPAGWHVFVHIEGEIKDDYVNADHLPVEGAYPLDVWKTGDVVRDRQVITLPVTWRSPHARVLVGLWRGNRRMDVSSGEADQRLLVATLPVKQSDAALTTSQLLALRTKNPPRIDGRLDEPDWKKALRSSPFVNTMTGASVAQRSTVRALWNDTHLYLAFANEDAHVWSTLKDRDDKLWQEEVVETFIDANADGKDYVELQVNPLGAVFDSYLSGYRRNQNDWNSSLVAAVHVEGTVNDDDDADIGWTVEMAIPWRDAYGRGPVPETLVPVDGNTWRVNFFRFDRPSDEEIIAMGWSPPLVGDFHRLNRFGELKFVLGAE